MRSSEVLDVAGGVLDLLDLERIDDEPELLHLVGRGSLDLLGHPVAVTDDLLNRESADNRAEVPSEHLRGEPLHPLLLVKEATRRVGDRGVVVADFEDSHSLDSERYAQLRHTALRDDRFPEVQ